MNSIEEQILKAQARGDFDNLNGAGRPFKIEDDSPFGQETRFAYGIVKQAGFTLAFIAERKQLQADMAAVEAILAKGVRRYDATPLGQLRWQYATAEFRQEAAKLNRRIQTYNLKAPNISFHLPMVDIDYDIARALEQAK